MTDERALFGLGEHLFAVDLFGRDALESDAFLEVMSRLPLPGPFGDVAFVRNLRDEVVPAFLDDIVAKMLDTGAQVFGFTATFAQVMASLAAARRIKTARPESVVIAGGACFDGDMGQEYHRALPDCLDHVFMGEAEESFREFLDRRKAGRPTHGIAGVTSVLDGKLSLRPGRPLPNLSDSPAPNYAPYFESVEAVRRLTGTPISVEALPFEGSRGCWWGQKNHCLFCGINRDLLGFREKPPERVAQEILTLSHLYGVPRLTATDWIISRTRRNDILQLLKDQDLDIEVFYETRSDLSKEEIRLLREGGALRVQPGIESFSTPVLKLMRKGTTGLRQVRFLKWAREYGVKASYNILCGFPGDEIEWYRDMIATIEAIPHLQPPTSNANFVELHRFSPLFNDPEAFGIADYALRADYRFNFPPGLVDPYKVGYFFEYESDLISDPTAYIDDVRSAIRPWIANWEARSMPRCDYLIGPGFVQIQDSRFGPLATTTLRGLLHDIFLLLDDIATRHELEAMLEPDPSARRLVGEAIDWLIERRLVLSEGHALLALPVAINPRATEALRQYVLGGAAEPVAAE